MFFKKIKFDFQEKFRNLNNNGTVQFSVQQNNQRSGKSAFFSISFIQKILKNENSGV